MSKEEARRRCEEVIARIKGTDDTKLQKRVRFKEWFKSKGLKNRTEFGNWNNYFTSQDLSCKNFDDLIYAWHERQKELKN